MLYSIFISTVALVNNKYTYIGSLCSDIFINDTHLSKNVQRHLSLGIKSLFPMSK